MANEKRVRVLNAQGLLNAALLAGTTTITFTTAPPLPTIDSTKHVAITLEPDTVNEEIVYVTAYTAGQLTGTILRGQEGTAAVPHSTGMVWIHGPTKRDFAAGRLAFAKRTAGNVTLGSTFDSAMAADSPAGYYKFDETSGTTMTDSSGNTRNGSISGSFALNQTPIIPDGGKAIHLTGGVVTLGNITAWQQTLMSYELWFYEDTGSLGSFHAILAKKNMWAVMSQSGTINFYNGISNASSGTATPRSGVHQLVLTIDLSGAANAVKIYLDSTLIFQGTWNTGQTNQSGDVRIGDDGLGDPAFQGMIDNFTIYSGVLLSQSRINAHWAARTGSSGTGGLWQTVDSGLDLVIPAFAGDIVEVGMSALVEAGTNEAAFDVASIVAGSPVNYWGGAGGATDYGIAGWASAASALGVGGPAMRQLAAGDVSAGACTLRLLGRSTDPRLVDATAARPLQFWAKNHGPQEAA